MTGADKPGFPRDVGKMRDGLGVCALGITSTDARRAGGLYESQAQSPKRQRSQRKKRMESHESPIIARSGPTRVNLPEISTNHLVERCAACEHASIFENALRVSLAWN